MNESQDLSTEAKIGMALIGTALAAWGVKKYFFASPSSVPPTSTNDKSVVSLESTQTLKNSMALEMKGESRIEPRGNSLYVQTTGENSSVMALAQIHKDEWLCFYLKGDAVLVYNLETNQPIAEVKTANSSLGLVLGNAQEVKHALKSYPTHSLSAPALIEGSQKSLSISDKAIYTRIDLCEYSDLTCPHLKKQSLSVGALVEKRYLKKEGGQYKITSDVLTLEEAYLNLHDGYKLDPPLPFSTQKLLACGTAFLGTSQRIITAGHCVAGNISIKNLLLVFGFVFDHLHGSPQSFSEADVYELERIVDYKLEEKEDWAVVELKRPVQNRLALERSEKTPENGTPLYVMGHPNGLPQKTDLGGRVKRQASHGANPHIFFSNLNTFCGNSGSPVFNLRTQKVEGILIRGEEDFYLAEGRREAMIATYGHTKAEEQCTTIQRVENALKATVPVNAPAAKAPTKKTAAAVKNTPPKPGCGRK